MTIDWTRQRPGGSSMRSASGCGEPQRVVRCRVDSCRLSFEPGSLAVARQISARSHSGSGLPEWNAYFTAGVPHEALTDFLLALGTRTEPAFSFGGPETVLAAACDRGRLRDIDRPHVAASAPDSPPAFRWRRCPRPFAMPILGPGASAGRCGPNIPSAIRTCGARPSAAARPTIWPRSSPPRSPLPTPCRAPARPPASRGGWMSSPSRPAAEESTRIRVRQDSGRRRNFGKFSGNPAARDRL